MHPRSERNSWRAGLSSRMAPGTPHVEVRRTVTGRTVAGRSVVGLLTAAIPMLLVACSSPAGPAPAPRPAAASVPAGQSAAQLARGHWVRVATPPIQACEPATAGWDGSALVVIESGAAPCHPGAAAYYPATNRWARMPTPPRATGRYPLAAWGGGRLVLVSQRTGFAAAWSPSTRRWARLPRVPGTAVISLTWTGRHFLAISSRQAYQATGRAWRLASGRWQPLPSLPPAWHG
jgi:hypothetical protein